jgi:HD-GYP domain-containing protein (c-di-GMP phosphodiesterase class II)
MGNVDGALRIDQQHLKLARDTAVSLLVLIKTARLYDANNKLYIRHSDRMFAFFRNYVSDRNSMTIKFVENRLLVDEQHVALDAEERSNYEEVIARWIEFDFGGITIGDACRRDHIDAFAFLLWQSRPAGSEPRQKLQKKLAELGIDSIALVARENLESENTISVEERKLMRQQARHTFFRAIATVKEVLGATEAQKDISVTRTRRVVHSIVDQISEDDAALIELTAIRDFDEYTYSHCTNVCIYSLTLGFRLGLSRKELLELGLAAIFHDIGKVKLPSDLINKPDRYDEFDWAQIHKHPVLGAMTVAKSMRLDSAMSRAMAVAFEHHINPDHTGYPSLPDARSTNVYSRIVAITDNFDALSSGRVYIKDPIPPDEVLRKLMYQMKAKFDPLLLKIFVGIIGIYPIGTMVLLSNDLFGIVSRTNEGNLCRPEVRIVADKSGEVGQPYYVDLNLPEFSDLNIVHIIEPEKYGFDLAGYILAD